MANLALCFAELAQYFAEMIESHPLVAPPPHAAFWRRSDRRAQAFRPSVHAELVVLFPVSGRARYFIDGHVVPLRPGALLFAWAGQAHFLISDAPDFDMWVALVSARFAATVPGFPAVDQDDPAEARGVTLNGARELEALSQTLHETHDASQLGLGLGWWLHRAWTHWKDARAQSPRALHPAVDRAARLLRADPDMPVGDLARAAGLSPGRLGKVFRAEMGQGLVAFRTAERLARVAMSVRVEGLALLPAALEAGFGSYAQFYRACRGPSRPRAARGVPCHDKGRPVRDAPSAVAARPVSSGPTTARRRCPLQPGSRFPSAR